MSQIALQQQRTVDRIALAGSLVALLAASAFIALDPVQTVARRAPTVATAPAVRVAAASERSPLVRLALPTATWTVVTDGSWAAYARLSKGEPAEIVVRSLRGEDWRVAYRAAPDAYLGQLSLAKGVLTFEEIGVPGSDALPSRISVGALDVASAERTAVDAYAPLVPASAAPITDGSRVLWVHQTAQGQEIREHVLATGASRVVYAGPAQLAGLSLWRDTLAFTVLAQGDTASYTLDLASGALSRIDGFAFSYVQSIGPSGVVVTASPSAQAAAASWLVGAEGTRTRLASDCFNITMTERVLAMRCASQIEVRDLATSSSLYRLAGLAGSLAVSDRTVVWGEGDTLVVYELPTLESRPLPQAE